MKTTRSLRLIAPALFAGVAVAIAGETKTTTVSEDVVARSVTFDSPTRSDGERYTIIINNSSSKYAMDTVTPVPESNTDAESWVCTRSAPSAMNWRILALKRTPLAYVISGGLTEILRSGSGSGPGSDPQKKSFNVTVPATTELIWRNVVGSHSNPMAKSRRKIAVGEAVSFTVANSHLGNPVWTATGGVFESATSGANGVKLEHEAAVTWYAPKSSQKRHTVTLRFPKAGQVSKGRGSGDFSASGNTVTVDFEVVLPTGCKVEKLDEAGSKVDLGLRDSEAAITVDMALLYTALPGDVNYSLMNIAEDTANGADQPKGITGYFEHYLKQPQHLDLKHRPKKEQGRFVWIQCNLNGEWADHADYPNAQSLTTDFGDAYWISGAYHWSIPLKCQGRDPQARDAFRNPGDGETAFTLTQTFSIQVAPEPKGGLLVGTDHGSVTLKCEKTGTSGGAVSVSRTLNL